MSPPTTRNLGYKQSRFLKPEILTIAEAIADSETGGFMKPEILTIADFQNRSYSPKPSTKFEEEGFVNLSFCFKDLGEKFSEIVGSPYYMVPELLKRSYGPEIDICKSEQGVAQTILRGLIDFKREPWPSVSEGAKSLVRQMLEPDPKL
ncbi:hypothetical protein L1987_09200 [Smallanthus sonchifolius]|uniref:Uncharacterized protein n=1 Tax=Smallanthus sonchifolius TaxID=185202 RepID=A0ACB9JNB6_9ASTR|nr:hypothetical protein L1987_09200 [Smallanthus sonchifolius]